MGLKRQLFALLLMTLVVQSLPAESSAKTGNKQETGTIKLTDPVHPEKPKRKHDLVVYKDSRGYPKGYAMDLVNEVCLNDVCKVVKVTMYWDAMGFYDRLEYPEGKPLTKLEHEPFTANDYEKLDGILKDRQSILNNHSLAYLAKEADPDPDTRDVEGVSKATPATVRQAVVKDAAWTTWVLWKYANTEIVPILCNATEAHCTPAYIEYMLDSKDWRNIQFVLKYLLKQDTVPSRYTSRVAQTLPTADMDQFELALQYLKRAINDRGRFYRQLIKTLPSLREYNAAMVIDQLALEEKLQNETLVYLTHHLDKASFYPIHLALRLIERRKFFSGDVERNVAKLLNNKDFFIARRASEFLAKQKLSPQTEQLLRSFRDKYADRL